jgi:hypothetical protein
MFRQFGFRQHFARFAQNVSICANGEIQYMSNSKSTAPGQVWRVWIQSVVHTGLKEGYLTLEEKMTPERDFY